MSTTSSHSYSFHDQLRRLRLILDERPTPSINDPRIERIGQVISGILESQPEPVRAGMLDRLEPFQKEMEKIVNLTKVDSRAPIQVRTPKLAETGGAAAAAPPPPDVPVVSRNLLFNLLADEFGNNSDLEGIANIQILAFVSDYIRKQPSLSPSFLEVLRELEIASKIENEDISSVLPAALKDNKPFLISGGWVGLPKGHAVYYEVIPQQDGTVNFRIFNTGSGSEEHQKIQVGVKEKIPYLEWQGIPISKLLDPLFSQIINEMKRKYYYPTSPPPSRNRTKTFYSENDLYKSLKDFLRPTSSIFDNSQDSPLMEPQRAGTCACRSLFAFLKSKLSLEEYQTLKLNLRIEALRDFIKSPVASLVEYHLVNKATEKLSRRVSDLFTKRVIGGTYLISAEREIKTARQWLGELTIEKPPLSLDYSFSHPINDLICNIETPEATTSLMPPIENSLSPIRSQIALIPLDNPETFTESILQVSQMLNEAYRQKAYRAVHFAVIDLIKRIPLNQEFWTGIHKTETEIENAINGIALVSEFFFKSCYRIKDSSPIFLEKQYALSKLLFIQKKLAQHLWPTILLPNCCIDFSFSPSSGYPYIQGLDPVISKELTSISTELVEQYNVEKVKDPMIDTIFGRWLETARDLVASMKFVFNDTRKEFIKIIQEKYPDILERIKNENPKFDTKKVEEQYNIIFLSSHLPSWIQSLKKSLMCLAFLENQPIVPLETQDISLNFQYIKNGEETHISLEGVTSDNFSDLSDEAQRTAAWSTNQAPVKDPMIIDLITLVSEKLFGPHEIREKHLYATPETSDCFSRFKTIHSSPSTESAINELLHIFISTSHRVIETLDYFTRHPDKMGDLDYQQLFQIACFNCVSDKAGFYRYPDKIDAFKEQIASFLTKQIALTQNEGDVKTQVFLQRMGRYFRRYECAAPDTSEHLLVLLMQAKTSPEEKSLIYSELAASLGELETLTQEQAILLLKAKAWIEYVPVPLAWKDPKTAYDIENALSKHSQALSDLLLQEGVPNTVLLNELYTLINETPPPEDLRWKATHRAGMSPTFESNNCDFYDPINGRLITTGLQGYLPLEIRDEFYFKELFPHQLKGVAVSSNLYEFRHGDSLIVVKKTEEGLTFEQIKEGRQLQFIPNYQLTTARQENVTCALESRFLADKFHAWHSISEPTKIFLYDKRTGEKTYEASYTNRTITSITRLSDKAFLSKPSALLAHIEHRSYIQEWYQGDKRIEVELPRFNLSFKPNSLGRLECLQHPGFFLNEDPNLDAIGECNYGLILKNQEGKIRALLPHQNLQKPTSMESLQPAFKRNQCVKKGESADFTYFTYDLSSSGCLECSSKEGYFYLAQTLAVHQDYMKAAHYLRTYGEKLTTYSQEEIECLEKIANIKNITGDESGQQGAIALYATYLLSTNKIRSADALKTLPKLYKQYLLRSRNITALRLSKEEELHLLKSLLPEPLTPQFRARLVELDSTYPISFQPQSSVRFSIPNNPLDFGLLKGIYISTNPLPADFLTTTQYPLITRPTLFIRNHLLEIINLAINGTHEQKNWIETACLFLTGDTNDSIHTNLAALLGIILKNHSRFPPFTQGQGYRIASWWKATLTEAQTLVPSIAASSSPSLAPPVHKDRPRSTDRDPMKTPDFVFNFNPGVSPNLIDIKPFSTCTSQAFEPMSENHELRDFLALQSSPDPVESAEWIRLQTDAAAFSQKPAKTIYPLITEISSITPVLEEKKGEITSVLTSLEERMVLIAATPPTDPEAQALFSLQKMGKLLEEITLDDIFISLALKDPKKLVEQNPHLTQENLNELYRIAAEYLQLASVRAQMDRCISLCKKTEKGSTEELKLELGQQLSAKRCYTIAERPEFLVFEYYAGIIMREDQVAKLGDFLQGDTSNPVMEMIMGSGKSKVLMPLLGLLRADGKSLSMVVVPSPLFESVSSDTQEILQKAFSKSLTTLYFERNSTFSKRSLQEITTFLETVISKKQCLIMTSKSLQSLMLKFIEYANTLKETGAPETEELKLMIGIISLLQKAGNPLIDEADTVLNVQHEVSFSLGQKVPPEKEEIQLIGTLYEILYSDPGLKHIARLESDPQPDMSADVPPLSETLYHNCLKEPLAKALIAKLIEQKNLPDDIDQKEVLAYLCRDESKAEELAAFFKKHTGLQNLLALAAEELCSLLPHTLLKTSDERYGLDHGVIAIPYAAANTPSHGSFFSNPYITMNYTFQIHAKNGIQEQTLCHLIQQLKIQAHVQIQDEGIPLEETIGYQQFCSLKGDLSIPFKQNLHPSDLRAILDRINRDPKIRQQLIEMHFLPQIQLFKNKLACNPINLIALFSKVAGFTGTLWNAGSMHSKLAARPEPGTDAKTLTLLMEKCQGPSVIIPKVAGESMFERLPAYDALIDAGGYFKEGGNLSIARKMALTLKKPVVFYNSKGVQTITDGKHETPLGASPLKEEERLTFYDQSHTTGADIKQKGLAVGLVTIGRGMILRDLLQSVWRLRGLEKGQTVQFVIDEEVASIIRAQIGSVSVIGFKEILKFVIQNQAKQQGDDNFKAFKQELDNLSQNLLLEVMTSSDYSAEQKLATFSYLSTTWIKPADQTPAELYGKPAFKRPSNHVIQEAADKCSVQLERILSNLPFLNERVETAKTKIAILAKSAMTSVPAQLISLESDNETTVEVEQATQIETEVSTEIETQGDCQLEPVKLGVINLPSEWEHIESLSSSYSFVKTPVFPIADQMSREPDLDSYKHLFEGIDISINILEWKEGENTLIDKMRLLGAHRTPFHHLIVEEDTVTLFSQIEDTTSHPNYYNLTLGFKDPTKSLSRKAFEQIVKLKFLNGESHFTKEELTFLEEWFTDADVDKMETLYLKHILKFQPDKSVAFEGSNLKRLFKELKYRSHDARGGASSSTI